MIRNETEYQEAIRRAKEEKDRLNQQKAKLKELGLKPNEVRRVTEPVVSFHLQLVEEIEAYERLKRGDLGVFQNLHGLGQALVALRIAKGLSQRELAAILNVHESQVSRDERNEYNGITLDRASKILDALEVRLTSRFENNLTRTTRSQSKPG